ncbi:MAG: uracil-DNA glycosylase [Syntrophomonadaceae bacterium]|nr:uracil-DNA glycosylase [Syntrophomonadaceae bacterium]
MEQLRGLNLECRRCPLREGCIQVVFGRGNPQADVMLIGEGPGGDEDEQGQPFVGRAGQLLDKILAASELPQEEVYIANMVKCRPPNNRLPNPNEIKACRGWLEAQIRLVAPKIIICLGNAASQSIIDSKLGIGKLRGRWYERSGIKIMATYHPAALLRTESYKRPTWEDFKIIRDEYKRLRASN